MALSNIFREPRREITEQALGTLAVVSFLAVDYGLARWVIRFTHDNDEWGEVAFIMFFLGIGAPVFLTIILAATHLIGEGVCALLTAAGLDPRPKRRA